MKKIRKIMSIMLVALLVMQLGSGCIGAFAASDYTIISPYEKVEWEGDKAWGAYKGTLHTHTTYSDATETLPTMIKEYYNQDYDFVANADHGITGVEWNKAPEKRFLYNYQLLIGYSFDHLTDEEYEQITSGSYPLYNGTIRNKEMVCVTGANELNHVSLTKNHVNGYFLPESVGNGPIGGENEYGYEQAVKFVDECGGLSHINHPGDWLASNSDMNNVNNKEAVEFFGNLILKYDSCLGTEVFNEDNGTTGYDRILWDNLLMYTLPYGKNVIGFSNTDAHDKENVDTSFSIFMMEKNDVDHIKETMQSGAFFGVTRKIRANPVLGPSNEIDAMNKKDIPYPMFKSLTVDGHKITANVTDASSVQFIANGEVIYHAPVSGNGTVTLDLDTVKNVEDLLYVRVEVLGEGGMCISQAMVIDDGTEPLKFEAPKPSFTDNLKAWFRGTIIYSLVMELIGLIKG